MSTVTPTVDSVMLLASDSDPRAFANPGNSSRAGMSFAEICAAQFSQSCETQTGAPAPALSVNPSSQPATTTTPANTASAKNSAKNTPSSSGLASLVALPQIALAIPVNALTSSPTQPVQSAASENSAHQAGSDSIGTIQATNVAPASATASGPMSTPLPSDNRLAPTVADPIPSLAPAAKSSPDLSASASAPEPDPRPLSSSPETDPTSASVLPSSPSAEGSPSVLPNGNRAPDPAPANVSTDAADRATSPEIISAAGETFGLDAAALAQVPPAATVSQASSVSQYAQPLVAPGDAGQASPTQVPAAQAPPALDEMPTSPAVPAQNIIQVAVASSSEPEQTAPADQKAPQRSVTQPRSLLDQETLRASSAPRTAVSGTLAASSTVTRSNPTSPDGLKGLQPAASSVRLPAPTHGISSSVLETPAAENSSNNAGPRQLGNPPANTAGTEASATNAASPSAGSPSQASSKKDSQGNSSDPGLPKDFSNIVVSAVDPSPASASPAFAVATPAAQVSGPQPSSLPDVGPKANEQTSDSAPHSSLPATTEAPPTANASPLQWAQMANKAGQSEMRIGLNTAEFGSVEVRTNVHASEVGVLIGSEKGDLRSLLTPELPGIASTLQQQDLRLAQVSFHQQGFTFAGDSSFSGGNSQPRSFASRPQPAAAFSEESSAGEPVQVSEPVARQRGSGLSILA